MKTILKKSIALLAAGIFVSFNIQAKDNEHPDYFTKAIVIADATKTIKDHVKFPNLMMNFNQEEKVNVVFTVNEAGQVNLVIANTSNEILKKAIETQFKKLTLNQLKANNAYSIQFNFKTI